ncbi:unnamed protein product, partial [Amoebophrya sp. A120]
RNRTNRATSTCVRQLNVSDKEVSDSNMSMSWIKTQEETIHSTYSYTTPNSRKV